jgi:hypothetical protein
MPLLLTTDPTTTATYCRQWAAELADLLRQAADRAARISDEARQAGL